MTKIIQSPSVKYLTIIAKLCKINEEVTPETVVNQDAARKCIIINNKQR